jgi:hypothetical protein
VEEEVLCIPSRKECVEGMCNDCSKGQVFFFRHPQPSVDDDNMLIKFKIWIPDEETGYLIRVEQSLPIAAAMKRFEISLPKFLQHHAVKRNQAAMYRAHKTCIDREPFGKHILLLHFDFAENFRCSYQDQIQSAYFSQRMITLFTVVSHSKDTGITSYVLASNNLDHGRDSCMKFLLYLFEVRINTSVMHLFKICFYFFGCTFRA